MIASRTCFQPFDYLDGWLVFDYPNTSSDNRLDKARAIAKTIRRCLNLHTLINWRQWSIQQPCLDVTTLFSAQVGHSSL